MRGAAAPLSTIQTGVTMHSLADRTIVVAGGTGNVGTFVVEALLARDATVVVPSRSEEKLEGLRAHLRPRTGEDALRRLHTFVGHLGDEADASPSTSGLRSSSRSSGWTRR